MRADGEAQAIQRVVSAIKAAEVDPQVLAYQYLQALPDMANGSANKVWVVPAGTELGHGSTQWGLHQGLDVDALIPVDDPGDERLRDYTDLTDVALRRVREPAEGLFMAESLAVIDRALSAGYRPRSVLTEQRWLPAVDELLAAHGVATTRFVAAAEVITRTTGFRMHRGPMAAMARLPLPDAVEVLTGASVMLVLDRLVDHTNVGAAFRSAAALGVAAVLVTPACADPLYRRSVRVSMGTVFSLPWTRTDSWQRDLADFTTLALTPAADAVDLGEIPTRFPARWRWWSARRGRGCPAGPRRVLTCGCGSRWRTAWTR